MKGAVIETGDKPFWAKCRKCSHCWPVAYLPMDMARFGRLLGRICCPKCMDRKPVIARQDNGVLLEGRPA